MIVAKALTGVRWHFSASHRRPNGQFHGHTWFVRAWWPEGECADLLLSRLKSALRRFDEKQLPDDLSRGEALAGAILEECDHLSPDDTNCRGVDLWREAEGIYVELRLTPA